MLHFVDGDGDGDGLDYRLPRVLEYIIGVCNKNRLVYDSKFRFTRAKIYVKFVKSKFRIPNKME